ncbi:VanW family protein [Paenibacillus sp. YSY-4.3]
MLLWSVFFGAIFVYAIRDTVPPGVTINGMDIGNLKRDKAVALVEEMIQKMELEKVVVTVQQTKVDSTWKELGVQYDASHFYDALDRLFEGSPWERAKARWYFPKPWELHMNLDEKKLRRLFTPQWEQSRFGSPADAVRLVSQDDTITYLPGHSVYRIDWITFGAIIRQRSPKVSQQEPYRGTRQAEQKQPVLEVPLYTLQPKVTLVILQRQGIERKITQYATGLQGSGEGRRHNIEAAARTIDGMVLAPGEIFNYEQVIKAAEDKYGFREAPVIFGGKLVPGVGGGICQVSSTLYNAVILAGLDVVERRNHTLPVSYVSKGLDATFARGYINFRFKNTTGRHLLIYSKVTDDQLTVKLFGDAPGDITYDVESFTTETISVPTKYVANSSLAPGTQETIIEGKPGYIVESYRIKKISGKPVSKVKLSRDTYPPQPTVIAIAPENMGNTPVPSTPGPEGTAPKILLEDGVKGPRF